MNGALRGVGPRGLLGRRGEEGVRLVDVLSHSCAEYVCGGGE